MKLPAALSERIAHYSEKLKGMPKLCKLYQNCCAHTLETAIVPCEDDTVFVLTGDIPAMWLRDSAAQVTHYIPLSRDGEMASIIEGVIKRQLMYHSKSRDD